MEMGLEEKGGSDVKKVYKPEFEAPLIVCTRRFYSVECSRWFETDSAPEYLRKVWVFSLLLLLLLHLHLLPLLHCLYVAWVSHSVFSRLIRAC